jgi:hypothetical protein
MTHEKKSVTKEQAEAMRVEGDSSLPPPGDERKEILSMRRDDLEKLAEEAAIGAVAFGKEAFEVDREIQHGLANALTNLQEDKYVYCLVCDRMNGADVWTKKTAGWEVVANQEDAVEAPGIKTSEGYRRIGDTILMRISKDQYVKIRAKQNLKTIQRDAAVSAQILEVAEEAVRKSDGAVRLIDPKTKQTPRGTLQESMASTARARQPKRGMSPREAATRNQASTAIDKMLREGRVPGMNKPWEKGGGS